MTTNNRFRLPTLIITLIIINTAIITGAQTPPKNEQSIPAQSRRAGQAIDKLKADGSYDSLIKSVNAIRQKDARTGELNQQNSFFQTAKLTAGDGATADRFGESISVSGDTVVVGAFLDDHSDDKLNAGSAYVFVRNGSGWTQQAQLFAQDGEEDDRFGSSVSIWNDTIIVGAMGDDINGNPNQGSAYIFTRSGNTWTQQAKLVVDNADITNFGFSTAMQGNTLIIGTLEDVGGNESQGSAYIFTGSGNTWTQQAKLTAADGGIFDRFGWSVGISGSTAIVGAYLGNVGNTVDQGSAYVFVRNGNVWTQQAKLVAADGAQFEEFGWSVDISGDTAVVGAREDEIGDFPGQGSAYVFVRTGNSWTQQAKLIDENTLPYSRFGWSVAVSGNTVAVGAMFGDVVGNEDEGTVCVFVRNGGIWRKRARLAAADASRLNGFGSSVAISGGNIYIGAEDGTVGNNIDQGSAYVFRVNTQPAAFDFDGDGRSDISVFRSANANWYLLSSGNSQFSAVQFGLGTDKITPADFDGDAKTDIAVFRDGNWYYLKSSDGQFVASQFGSAGDIPAAGDFDGDGKADLAVFRPANGTWYRLNSGNGAFVAAQFGANDDKPQVADFDGDGKTDIAVFRPANGGWYYLRSSDGSFHAAEFGQAGDIATSADFDGDGKGDIAVFRPSNGTWYRINSGNNQFVATQFGVSEDKPAAADYDGDGKSDIAVFRPSNGTWYLLRSTAGFAGLQFGSNGDLPTPSAFGQ